MDKTKEKFNKLSILAIMQLMVALICTISIPVFAWFAYQNKIEALSKIKEPPVINLASGGDDPALYVTLENIDVTDGTEKWVVFSVEPGKYPFYDLQLSHTTNIPFKYQLYRVKEDENGKIEYTDHTRDIKGNETKLLYSVISEAEDTEQGEITLTDYNPDDQSTGRILGDEAKLAQINRGNYADNDEVNQYVKPLYSLARGIPRLNDNIDGSNARDYFVIKITWSQGNGNYTYNDKDYWNYAFNNKETDIIYISAKQNTNKDQ